MMLVGTGSDVGKSLLMAGLCRVYTRQGLRVSPFKPQNMSNNAAVARDGGEIGRAQALQARACKIPPSVHMNPVLLKPQHNHGAQVVVRGTVTTTTDAQEYQILKPQLMNTVLESFEELRSHVDLVLIEGAGSAAEINLRHHDIANMGFASAVNAPALLVGDIDRGGVIAAIVGVMSVLPESDRTAIKGFVINRFRGDVSLFDEGLDFIRENTGLESLGVVPHFPAAVHLPAEDSLALTTHREDPVGQGSCVIAVPVLPHIANFDDLDPLKAEPQITLRFVHSGTPLPGDADLIVLPGSKAVMSDLAFLRNEGWDIDLHAHIRRGGFVLGLCGGYQMLGRIIRDPDGIEGLAGEMSGLGLLDIETVLEGNKVLGVVKGVAVAGGAEVEGYEIHAGRTTGSGLEYPLLRLGATANGAVSKDGRIMGSYLHGLFGADGFRQDFLQKLNAGASSELGYETQIEDTLESLADHLENTMALDRILEIAGLYRNFADKH
ncbi:MAG: cobyric acid synthase [Parvularculales bacterium]